MAPIFERVHLNSYVGVSLIVSGAVLTLTSLTWDLFAGVGELHFGQKQILGSVTGAFLVWLGLSLWRRESNYIEIERLVRWRFVVFAVLLAVISFFLSKSGETLISKWVIASSLAAICALLPGLFGVVTLLLGASAIGLLSWISTVKADVLGLPLTMRDIWIAAENPSGLWDALGLTMLSRAGLVSAALIISLIWFASGLQAAKKLTTRKTPAFWRDAFIRVSVIGLLVAAVLVEIGTVITANAGDQSTWHPERVTRLSERMGILPFLAFSYQLESRGSRAPFYARDASDPGPPSSDEIDLAVRRYADLISNGDTQPARLPNVIVVLAEGTFDPGTVFRLQGTWNSDLFRADEQTRASGLLKVNSVGGGTWIAEFETIVGLDSRLFGLDGMYTHYSLSPFVMRSFATYMEGHGYETWAFFGATGKFYNGRNAYVRYGFDRIIDSEDLGRGAWFQDDRTIAADVVDNLRRDSQGPFFAYIKFLENHAPHECKAKDQAGFTAHFLDSDDFGPNCLLNDYLRRLANTSSAVRTLREFLESLERETGRPYVLLVFGDHQPHTFTTSIDNEFNWSPMKETKDPYVTFFRIDSSMARPLLDCCMVALPVWALPTLLSTFVAQESRDLFLGVNLWLYSECGPDAINMEFPSHMDAAAVTRSDTRPEQCKHALRRATAAYRDSGIMSVGG